jgi:hypothetical protein
MTESQVVNEWISQGEAKGKLSMARQDLLKALEVRFPGEAPEEIVRLIQQQESLAVLVDWFDAILRARTFEKFMEVLRR